MILGPAKNSSNRLFYWCCCWLLLYEFSISTYILLLSALNINAPTNIILITAKGSKILSATMRNELNYSINSLYEAIINFSDDAIISKSLEGEILSWNRGAERIFGYSAEEILHQHISLLVPAHRQDEDLNILEKIRRGESIEHYETERIRKDGRLIFISLTVSPMKDQEGTIIGASKIARDVTDQKLKLSAAAKMMREINDYKFALDQSCIVAITDQKGTIRHVNENFCRISGYSRGELLGQDHRIVNSKYHGKEFIRGLWVTIANGKIWKGELRNQAKEGTYYWVDTTIVPFVDEAGKPVQYLAIRSDITHRKQAEEKNAAMQARYRLVAENMLDGLLIRDRAGQVIYQNEQYLRLFGISVANGNSVALEQCIAPEYHDFIKAAEQGRAEGYLEAENFELEGMHNDGSRIWLEARICSVIENGELAGFQYVFRNISRQKIAEAERMKIIADIVQRNKDLEQFSYIISHNLRAPVANIMGIASLFVEQSISEEEKQFLLESLAESTQRLDNTIIDLNQVTQIKLSSSEINEMVSFSQLVADITASISHLINGQHITIETDFGDIDSIFSVRSYLHSIFYNLITNSIKYKKSGVPLLCRLSSMRRPGFVQLTVRDNGLGIDLVKTGDQIFEIYKRFHLSAADGKGMGLFMVKAHVESLRGSIAVDSKVNEWTEFRIELPLQES